MKITNQFDISLPMAVWLLHDDYDYNHDPDYISATSLLKSTKQLILSRRTSRVDEEMDLSTLIASSLGNAIHDSIEKAWKKSGVTAMAKLGYPAGVTDNVIINPTDEQLEGNPKAIPIWFEQRSVRNFGKYKIGGKFDLVMDGRLFDHKSTSVYTYIIGGKDEDYALQGSIYRWLNQNLITSDHIYINFLFTDWQRSRAKQDKNYPQSRVKEHPVPLLSIAETERFIGNKLAELDRLWDAPESAMPECTDKELWRSEPQYKYYANPEKTEGRSTRNFDTMGEAQAFMVEKAGKGVIKTIPGEVKACDYCRAFNACKQKDRYYVGSL